MHLRILHLSDLHFTREDVSTSTQKTAAFNAKMVTTAMLEKISSLKKTDSVHLVVITGDIAFSGNKEEYDTATHFCGELLKTTGLSKDNLFIVPGNHDVNRAEIELLLHRKLFYTFESQDEITALLTNNEFTPVLMKKLKNYNLFANTTTNCPNLSVKSFFYVEPVIIENFMINLAGLNSALFAGYDGDDKNRLALGIFQVNNAVQRLNNQAILTIGFFHHPFSCFHDIDDVSENILMNRMHIILTGHLHKPRPSFLHTGAGKALLIGAGASFETRENYNSFDIVDIDLPSGKGNVQFYKYLSDHNMWRENKDMGKFPFQLDIKKAGDFPRSQQQKEIRRNTSVLSMMNVHTSMYRACRLGVEKPTSSTSMNCTSRLPPLHS